MRQTQNPPSELPKDDTDLQREHVLPRMIEARQLVQEYINSLRGLIRKLTQRALN
ncbi:hypothetical protein [Bradyrhizobium sp. MOS002]|uniref:hypothetical protein n=1 Tax=Bradyrhizobium sp. MOS002 TaxID=2133947 RepID=UPI001304EC03|nr:hypothetical protein [Bradyrhizobium sp. MOS002]